MLVEDKIKTLKYFLDKLNKTGSTSREEVLSLESAIDSPLYTSKKDIVYLAPSSACVGVQEVKEYVKEEIKRFESEAFVTYTKYIYHCRTGINNLYEFREKIIKQFKSLSKPLIDLLKSKEFRLVWFKEKHIVDDVETFVVKEYIDDVKGYSFFDLFLKYEDHFKAICELNQDKHKEIYVACDSDIKGYMLEFDSNTPEGNLSTPIFGIFTMLEHFNNKTNGIVIRESLPSNIFTVEEFCNVYDKITNIESGLDYAIDFIRDTLNHKYLEKLCNEARSDILKQIEKINLEILNPKLALLGCILKNLNKI